MYREYVKEPSNAVSQPRGKSPQQSAFFTRSPKLQEESSLLPSVCSLLGALPNTGTPINRQPLASLSCGDLWRLLSGCNLNRIPSSIAVI
jgi:hypothetical protein